MSEALPGMEMPLRIARPKLAAVVILVRESTEGSMEVFWVRRGGQVSFSGGFYAFPGGRIDDADESTPIENATDELRGACVAAIRETFEETGVLLSDDTAGIDPARLDSLRRELLGGARFTELLAREGIHLDAAPLLPAGRWITPAFSPIRFDAFFFLTQVPRGTAATVIPGELTDGAWIRPADALARWEEGRALLHPPNHHTLATLAGFAPEDALPRLMNPPFVKDHSPLRVEFQRGVHLVALRTPTLPPATHTNCFVVGTGELAVIDPGAPDSDEQEPLTTQLDALVSEGRRVASVLLTHHHIDHVGAARSIAERYGVPIRSSKVTADRLPGARGDLSDGSVVELAGPRPMTLRALLTEGHAPGHLCFLEEHSRALFAGDMVSSVSTVVIDPPEGDMGTYLASLERLRSMKLGTIYPAHGVAIPHAEAKLTEYIDHRHERLRQLEAALRAGPLTVAEAVERVYTDTHPLLHPVAERSALASLQLMESRGRCRQEGDRWHLTE